MGAAEQTSNDKAPLTDEPLSTPEQLAIRNIPIIVQLRIVNPVDPNYWHMQITPAGLGRFVVLIAMAIWTVSLVNAPMDDVVGSFMHSINLPFHEAGHIIFAPFGRFMMTLGGSLMQVLVPIVCAVTLYFQTGDPFGAALCVWWMGENLVDLAPYINDARALELMLLGGPASEVEGHDWEAILTSLEWLRFDHTIARGAHVIGAAVMTAALVWAAIAIVRDERRLGSD